MQKDLLEHALVLGWMGMFFYFFIGKWIYAERLVSERALVLGWMGMFFVWFFSKTENGFRFFHNLV